MSRAARPRPVSGAPWPAATPWTYYRLVRKVGALDSAAGDVELPDSVQVSGQLDVET